ncbi:STAS domain-containing protein [Novosphingobium sp. SL115]|uniref:STAS domain-containing protein n=1 Tax=Novosphingobium sp. SL115 TaxID=2995150 RepID=UPI0022765115|nr:STAS domain-containing protein [Novosphingobium sp. SL115]MCY1672583.1 STAS domain-containing protein [Novosphingobium sp. SL115]
MFETLECGSNVQLATVCDLTRRLRHLLESDCDIEIDADNVERVDISFIQAIEATRLQAEIEGRTLRLKAPANAVLASTLDQSGVLWEREAADLQFWFHQREDA